MNSVIHQPGEPGAAAGAADPRAWLVLRVLQSPVKRVPQTRKLPVLGSRVAERVTRGVLPCWSPCGTGSCGIHRFSPHSWDSRGDFGVPELLLVPQSCCIPRVFEPKAQSVHTALELTGPVHFKCRKSIISGVRFLQKPRWVLISVGRK